MSMLHSFYCWGYAGVVLISTLFFSIAGIGNWRILALIWALLPLGNAFVFTRVPIAPLIEDARNRARTLLRDDPELSGDVQLAGAVLDFTRGNETYLTSN